MPRHRVLRSSTHNGAKLETTPEEEQVNRVWSIHTTAYCQATERNRVLMHATT